MKPKIIVCFLFSLFILLGCDQEPEFEIYENHNIPACGITDPLQNISWLKTYVAEHLNSYSATISIYKSNSSELNHIIIETSSKFVQDVSPSPIFTTSVYSCEGERLMFQGSEGPTPDGWNIFFIENTLIAKIWEVKEKY